MKVYPFSSTNDQLFDIMGTSDPSIYLLGYLEHLNANTVVIEEDYIDKDYLIDYANYYARSFIDYKKKTTRLHFFTHHFNENEFKNKFHEDKSFQNDLNDNYLGFVVVKPICGPNGEPMIGRTIIKTYPEEDNSDYRNFITQKYSSSLYGIPLEVNSLPYQTQDSIVAACSTTAIWTSLHALNSLFGTKKESPFEVTNSSISVPGFYRNFPSKGLDILQMKAYFESIGMETETIKFRYEHSLLKEYPGIIPDFIKGHLDYGLPVVAILDLLKGKIRTDSHAVVISGYRSDKHGDISELYVHDDRIGPYSKVVSSSNQTDFLYWQNEWVTHLGFDSVKLDTLLVPLYPKIRLSYLDLHNEKDNEEKNENNSTLFLTDLNHYKNWLLDKDFEDKQHILTSPFPKYLWIIRSSRENRLLYDFVFDATTLSINEPHEIINYTSDELDAYQS